MLDVVRSLGLATYVTVISYLYTELLIYTHWSFERKFSAGAALLSYGVCPFTLMSFHYKFLFTVRSRARISTNARSFLG